MQANTELFKNGFFLVKKLTGKLSDNDCLVYFLKETMQNLAGRAS